MIALIRLASVIATILGLTACVTNAQAGCSLVDGQWTCVGDVRGN